MQGKETDVTVLVLSADPETLTISLRLPLT